MLNNKNAYVHSTEIDDMLKTIPKQYHKSICKIITLSFESGVARVQEILDTLATIQPKKINEYDIWHADDIDGG